MNPGAGPAIRPSPFSSPGSVARPPSLRASAATLVLAALLEASVVSAATYAELRSAAVARCQAIDPAEYQTGLFLNPDGYRSYYVRSECFQRAAAEFRDGTLCDEVKRRFALLSSSWGYSRAQCRKLVAQ